MKERMLFMHERFPNGTIPTASRLHCHNLQRRVYRFVSWHQHENLEPSSPKPKDLHGTNLKQYTTVRLRDGPWQHWMQLPQPVRGADGITTKHGVMNMARLNRVYFIIIKNKCIYIYIYKK